MSRRLSHAFLEVNVSSQVVFNDMSHNVLFMGFIPNIKFPNYVRHPPISDTTVYYIFLVYVKILLFYCFY
ncbi:hypothetical protein LFUMFP_310190 [Latilactobacillus fuchuensis]|uniref:Uncharacterized protein n=1 Tax=Latilactobacillus fuchuensis TaxID=164393 RepID=A0A2N9DWW4_9LACO|nr:hypothetical protein LFUMFP_310190 [Latilactobacillus fuchuensis]